MLKSYEQIFKKKISHFATNIRSVRVSQPARDKTDNKSGGQRTASGLVLTHLALKLFDKSKALPGSGKNPYLDWPREAPELGSFHHGAAIMPG